MKAKHLYLALFVSISFLSFSSCDNPIEKNGLTHDINEFISQDILNILDSMGMPIYTGGNPPNIEGKFISSPDVLLNSTRSDDKIGQIYTDIYLNFTEQNKSKLTINVNEEYSSNTGTSGSGTGTGSFIVGNDKYFSVFTKIKMYSTQYNDSTLLARIYSGELSDNGIINYTDCLVMVDDYGDPNNQYIEIGDTRVFYDSDSIAERITDTMGAPIKKSAGMNLLNSIYSNN